MASQQKQERIFIFNRQKLGKNKDIFNFSWQNKVTTNPRHYSRSIWHHRKNKNKKMIFNDRNLEKTRIFFNFSWRNKVTTNPRPKSRSIWRHRKKKKKYLFSMTETCQKNKDKFFMAERSNNKPQTPTQGLYGVIGKRRKNIYFILTTETNPRPWSKKKQQIFIFNDIFLIFHGRTR